MKIITIALSLACLSPAALAGDLATPTPSPTPAFYRNRHGRRAVVWHQQHQAPADSRAQQRAKQKADRASAETAQAEARESARTREKAQREVEAQNRRQARNEKPQPTSEVMRRMGFSEKEIADQKAAEQSAGADSKKTTDPTSPSQ